MTDFGPRDAWVSEQLSRGDEVAYTQLIEAFKAVAQPFTNGISLQEISDAYTAAGFWYAVSKDNKRRAKNDGSWGDEEVMRAQLVEDYMEALVKAADKTHMTAAILAKRGGS